MEADSSYLSLQNRIVDLHQSKSPSIVRVTGVIDQEGEENKKSTVSSTGFIISSCGYVLTSSIPVKGVERIIVEQDGLNYFAEVVGLDLKTRLALVKIKESPENFSFISLTELDEIPSVGNFLIPISRRYGQAPAPYLSSLLGETNTIGFLPTTFIRANVQMAKGEPGAPVFDLNNRLVGVLVAYSTDVGESLIIPAHAANRVVEDLKNFGAVQYAWIGMDVDLKVSLNQGQRLFIKELVEEGPAEQGGLLPGDRILAIGEREIKSLKDLQEVMFFTRSGSIVPVRVYRLNEDKERVFSIQVEVKPEL